MTAIFNFNGTDLRTIEIEGEPWFVAADVCRCLGLDITGGVGRHLHRLDEDESRLACRTGATLKRAKNNPRILPAEVFEWRRGEGHTTIIAESGLYKLIMRSDKDAARPFQDWVTKVVLPSIRKAGGYQASEEQPMAPMMQALAQFLEGLLQPMVEPLRAEVVSLRDYVEKQNALIEKLAAGDSPVEYWWDSRPMSQLAERHLRNALNHSKREGNWESAAKCERELLRRRRAA